MEKVGVDPQRMDVDPLHPGVGQARGGVPGGGHHRVEAGIGLGPEVEGRALGPVAEVQGGQRRRIGVAEADHRHAQRLAGLQRRVAGHEDVARLDHVGLQHLQHGFPLGDAGRHPVAVAERQAGRRHGHQARLFRARSRAGHHQGMADIGSAGLQPGALGGQVAFHPARAGRVHHGGVDEVETAGGTGRVQRRLGPLIGQVPGAD
jgi:hypothetical protein